MLNYQKHQIGDFNLFNLLPCVFFLQWYSKTSRKESCFTKLPFLPFIIHVAVFFINMFNWKSWFCYRWIMRCFMVVVAVGVRRWRRSWWRGTTLQKWFNIKIKQSFKFPCSYYSNIVLRSFNNIKWLGRFGPHVPCNRLLCSYCDHNTGVYSSHLGATVVRRLVFSFLQCTVSPLDATKSHRRNTCLNLTFVWKLPNFCKQFRDHMSC